MPGVSITVRVILFRLKQICSLLMDYVGYRRTVLVLLNEDDAPSILFAAGGVTYALQRLKRSNSSSPTADDVKMANLVVDRLSPTDKTTATLMVNYSLKWRDVNMWKRIIKKGGYLISTFGVDKIVSGMKVFSFEGVRER